MRGEHPFLPHTRAHSHTQSKNVSILQLVYFLLLIWGVHGQFPEPAAACVRSCSFSCRDAAVAQTFGQIFFLLQVGTLDSIG